MEERCGAKRHRHRTTKYILDFFLIVASLIEKQYLAISCASRTTGTERRMSTTLMLGLSFAKQFEKPEKHK